MVFTFSAQHLQTAQFLWTDIATAVTAPLTGRAFAGADTLAKGLATAAQMEGLAGCGAVFATLWAQSSERGGWTREAMGHEHHNSEIEHVNFPSSPFLLIFMGAYLGDFHKVQALAG